MDCEGQFFLQPANWRRTSVNSRTNSSRSIRSFTVDRKKVMKLIQKNVHAAVFIQSHVRAAIHEEE
jgi:hypothetical protein